MAIAGILYKSFYWKALQFAAAVAVNIVLVRSFQSSVSAGFYALVYLLSLITGFFTFGLDIGLNFYLSSGQISRMRANRIILLVLALALSISLPLICLFYRPSPYPAISMSLLLPISALYIAGNLFTTLSGALYTAHGQNYRISRLSFFVNCLVLVFSLVSGYFFTGTALIQALFGIYFLFSFLQGLVLFAGSFRLDAGSFPDPQKEFIRPASILRFSFGAFIANFIFFSGSRLYLYLLPYRIGASQMGNYFQAFKVLEYLGLAASFIYYPFMSLVAGQDREKMNRLLLSLVRISNTFVGVFSVFILITGSWLFPFLFGNSFDRLYFVFLRFIPGLFALCSSSFFTAYFFGTGNIKYNLVSAGILFLSMLCFYFPFVRAWGLGGAAIGFSLATSLSFLYDIRIFGRSVDFSFRDILWIRKKDIYSIYSFVRHRGTSIPSPVKAIEAPGEQDR